MDDIDRILCDALQRDGRTSSAELAKAAGVPHSTANDRVRKLVASGVIASIEARLDADRVGAGFCCHILIDMAYEGEDEAVAALRGRPEVLELHHISGPHSYLAKVRGADATAMQAFLQNAVKPLRAIQRTETMISMSIEKETAQLPVVSSHDD